MNLQHSVLKGKISQVLAQWKRIIFLRGGSKIVLAALVMLGIAIALDSLLELPTAVRITLLVIFASALLTIIFLDIIRPLQRIPTETQLARYLEEKHPHLEDRLVTAIELGDTNKIGVSEKILEKLLEDTRFHVEPLNLKKSVRTRDAFAWGGISSAAVIFLIGMMLFDFNFFSFKVNRFITPWDYPTIKPKPELAIEPGSVRIPRGSEQVIAAELTGFYAEEISLYFSESDTGWKRVEMNEMPSGQEYAYNFFDLQEDTKYYIKADEKLSEVYSISLYDAPKITDVDLLYHFPAYTGLKPKREIGVGDIWAPEGTVVTIQAVADKPLKSAQITLTDGRKLKTSVSEDSIVVAKLTITKDTEYKILITDFDELANEPPPEYYVHAIRDKPPVISLEWPGRDVKASMLEEVSLSVKVQDDYGVPNLKLKYAVNGQDIKEANLRASSTKNSDEFGDNNRSFNSEHLFYLEDFNVKPGDFVSYFVEAHDSKMKTGETVNSDIFFIEIRPFETEFTRPLSQGGGMPGAGNMGGKLSQTQKQVLIATWKSEQKVKQGKDEDLKNDIDVLIESQENLLEIANNIVFQMKQRSMFTKSDDAAVIEFYSAAADAMQKAAVELQNEALKEAQKPQNEALKNLLQAEAQIREVEIQQGQGRGGQSENASLDQLSQLFDDEMDKLKSKYETLNDGPSSQNKEVDEALDKIKDLAKRQGEFNRRMRELERERLSNFEKKRRIEELRREQEQLRRETQELARKTRDMQKSNSKLPREVQQNLQQAASEMNNASHNLQNQNTRLAKAKGQRASRRLNQLENFLQHNQKESLRQQVGEIEQKYQDLLQAQKDLTEELDGLSREKEVDGTQLKNTQVKQKKLHEDLAATNERMESLSERVRKSRNETSQEIKKANDEIVRSGLEQKMQTAENHLQNEKIGSALDVEKDIQTKLEKASGNLTQLRSRFAETATEKLDLALNQTRRLREEIETLQQELKELNRQDEGEAKSEDGTGEGEGRSGEPGPGENRSQETSQRGKQIQKLNEQLAESMNELDRIGNSVRMDSTLARNARSLGENMGGVLRTFSGSVQERIKLIESQVLVPLGDFEAELAQKLELLTNKEKLFIAREDKIPTGYEELVEKYYEALSRTGKE